MPLRPLLGVLASTLLLLPGCSYATQRIQDTFDIGRIEGSIGIGVQAEANLGEFFHLGVGSSYRHVFGLQYGLWNSHWQTEDHLPLSYLWTMLDSDHPYLHRIWIDGKESPGHRCYVLIPGEANHDVLEKRTVHYFDIEAGAHALLMGLNVGFSLGEFFDWLLGWFKFSDRWTWMDLGDDDRPEQREKRVLYEKRERMLGKPLKSGE